MLLTSGVRANAAEVGLFEGGVRSTLLIISIVALAACATPQWSVGFPDLPIEKPAAGAREIGVAETEDSRSSIVVGWKGLAELRAGPGLPDYLESKLRNELVERGLAPVEALDPTKTSVSQPYKVIVLTLQSAEFEWAGIVNGDAVSEIGIGVRIYAPGGKLIYSASFSGKSDNTAHLIPTSVAAGDLIAPAADEAVKAAFADPRFEKAIR